MSHSFAIYLEITDIIDDITPTLIPVRSSGGATIRSDTFLISEVALQCITVLYAYAAEPHGEGVESSQHELRSTLTGRCIWGANIRSDFADDRVVSLSNHSILAYTPLSAANADSHGRVDSGALHLLVIFVSWVEPAAGRTVRDSDTLD